MRIALWGIFAALTLAACGTLKQNPDPITGIEYYTTQELLDMRETYETTLSSYKGMPNDMTNRKRLTTLKDETAGMMRRKQAQIERELKRRYDGGEKAAYYPGVDGKPVPAPEPVPGTPPTAPSGPLAPLTP